MPSRPSRRSRPSAAYTEALTGDDGCEPRARRLEGDLDKVANEYSPALVDIWNPYQADPAVREAEDRWRQCMQAEGHPFETRAHAEDELARQYALLADDPAASTEFREREIAVALADFDCAEGDRERLDQILNDRWAGFEAEHRNDILRDLRDLAER